MDPPTPIATLSRADRLEELLALAVALLADERGISIDQVRDRLLAPLQSAPDDQRPTGTGLLRIKEVKAKVGLSTSTIYRWIAAGDFPVPVKLGAASAWREQEIDQWLKRL
jgi:prophage regulatory protein